MDGFLNFMAMVWAVGLSCIAAPFLGVGTYFIVAGKHEAASHRFLWSTLPTAMGLAFATLALRGLAEAPAYDLFERCAALHGLCWDGRSPDQVSSQIRGEFALGALLYVLAPIAILNGTIWIMWRVPVLRSYFFPDETGIAKRTRNSAATPQGPDSSSRH